EEQAVLVSTYEAVPENLRTEFMRLTDMGHPHEIKAFLDKYVPNSETISARAIEREVKEFKEELQKQL
ncbi:hypothetical protein KW798_02515, partial [Candidatus Parcubacteria bacterium]|nr:hypothetical protein [Candidatus Parcubacteria bacterium]